MATVQAKVSLADGHESVLPIVVPSYEDVRAFARRLNAVGESWAGEAFGWQAEYIPESPLAPLASRLGFTPAEFWIGESGVWFFSMTWEKGRQSPATEYVDDSAIVRQ